MKPRIKLITETKKFNTKSYLGVVTRFIELNGKKLRMVYECSNGTTGLDVCIMLADGSFKQILSKNTIGDDIDFVSYVSNPIEKDENAKKCFTIVENLLEKLYS